MDFVVGKTMCWTGLIGDSRSTVRTLSGISQKKKKRVSDSKQNKRNQSWSRLTEMPFFCNFIHNVYIKHKWVTFHQCKNLNFLLFFQTVIEIEGKLYQSIFKNQSAINSLLQSIYAFSLPGWNESWVIGFSFDIYICSFFKWKTILLVQVPLYWMNRRLLSG